MHKKGRTSYLIFSSKETNRASELDVYSIEVDIRGAVTLTLV